VFLNSLGKCCMLLILRLVAFLVFFLILREAGLDWRSAVLGAAVFWGTCVVLITEILSVPRLIARGPVAISWLTICVAAFLYLRMPKRLPMQSCCCSRTWELREFSASEFVKKYTWDVNEHICLGLVDSLQTPVTTVAPLAF
jgi:hypothetical protein